MLTHLDLMNSECWWHEFPQAAPNFKAVQITYDFAISGASNGRQYDFLESVLLFGEQMKEVFSLPNGSF